MKPSSLSACLCFLLLTSLPALAGPVTITEGIAPWSVVEDFERFAQGEYEYLAAPRAGWISESFVGQTVVGGAGDTVENITSNPTAPLTLDFHPAAGDGVYIADIGAQKHVLFGLADGTGPDDISEGVFSMQFFSPRDLFGFTLVGGGHVRLWLFAEDATFLYSETMDLRGRTYTDLTVETTGTPIAGFTILPSPGAGGFGIDDLRVQRPIPAPSSTILLLLGFAAIWITRPRR